MGLTDERAAALRRVTWCQQRLLDPGIKFVTATFIRGRQQEREFNLAENMVAEDRRDVDPKVWTNAHTESISRTPVLFGRVVDARGSSVRDCGCYGCDRPVAVRGRTVFRKRNEHLVRCQWRLADRFGWRPVVEGLRRALLGLRRRLNDANDLKRTDQSPAQPR
jgi:hypothetical protein